jgi:hypothetical protein
MKKVLVIHYSQTGQLSRVVRRFTEPLDAAEDVQVDYENLRPVNEYPFPWPFFKFLDTFPECVYLDPDPIEPLAIAPDADYDLVIIAYQVWFLSPSLPITAFLQSEEARTLLRDKPVITVIACRNMWLMAQEEMKQLLSGVGARLVGNAVLTDEAGSLWSLLATPIWVLSGRKGPLLGGLIPRAGVSDHDVEACDRFGARLLERFRAGDALQDNVLRGLNAVYVDEKLILSERTARRGFRIWGRMIRACGPHGAWLRKPILAVYAVFLVVFLLTFVPVTMLLKKIMAPFLRRQIQEQKDYFSQPSGAE